LKKDVYIFKNGELKRKDNTILFESKGKKTYIPVEMVERLHLFGKVSMNTDFLEITSKHKIIINFYNYYGFYIGSFIPRETKVSGYLTIKQSEKYLDSEERMYLATSFVDGAIFNMKRNIRKKKSYSQFIKEIESLEKHIYQVNTIPNLMGVEGQIRNIYYTAFSYLIKNEEFNFEKRSKRPPLDPINALISFGNSMIYTAALAEIYKTNLNPTISYLHEPSEKRYSLILDVTEIFKPLIIDPLILKLINNKILTLNDFDIEEKFTYLNESGKKKFITYYEEKMSSTVKHRKLNRNVSYRGLIRLEYYKLIRHIIDDQIYKPLKPWW